MAHAAAGHADGHALALQIRDGLDVGIRGHGDLADAVVASAEVAEIFVSFAVKQVLSFDRVVVGGRLGHADVQTARAGEPHILHGAVGGRGRHIDICVFGNQIGNGAAQNIPGSARAGCSDDQIRRGTVDLLDISGGGVGQGFTLTGGGAAVSGAVVPGVAVSGTGDQ